MNIIIILMIKNFKNFILPTHVPNSLFKPALSQNSIIWKISKFCLFWWSSSINLNLGFCQNFWNCRNLLELQIIAKNCQNCWKFPKIAGNFRLLEIAVCPKCRKFSEITGKFLEVFRKFSGNFPKIWASGKD